MKTGQAIMVVLLTGLLTAGCSSANWRTASRESAGIAPDPKNTQEAVVHVYGADAWGWRGWFAIHTWIAVKPAAAESYTVYDVVGWRGGNGRQVVRIREDIPDRHWYGAKPRLLADHRGPQAQVMIDKIDQAARAYPWKTTYRVFPGPNSNTFIGWIGRQVPEMELDLPLSAIGAGYGD
ncbi:MAG: DUF3750 domain-containing protein [Pseudomonadota bacterium]